MLLQVREGLTLDEAEIELEFVRAGGPGGQNVNKVATAVQLRFDVAHSPSLGPDVRQRLLQLAGRRATGEGVLVLHGRRFRTQERNRADVLERLLELVRRAAEPPPPPRRPTRPTAGSRVRRLAAKTQRGETKRQRRGPTGDEG